MDVILQPLFQVIHIALGIYKWIVIIYVVMSWLVAFGVVNRSNQFVNMVGDFTARLTEPALAPIKRFVPTISGIDLSPLILLLVIFFLQGVIQRAFLIGY